MRKSDIKRTVWLMNVSRASFCAELAVLRMSHQIKQVSPGRAVKVRDDSAKGQEISKEIVLSSYIPINNIFWLLS